MKNILKPLALIVVASAGLLLASGQPAQAQSELLPPACCDGLNVCCCANHCVSVGGNAYCW